MRIHKIVLTALIFAMTSSAFAKADPQTIILNDINQYRHEHGLTPLKLNNTISQEAAKHSRRMADNIIPFSHQGFEDRQHHLTNQFPGTHAVAENVAYTYRDATTVVGQWLNSRGHRQNIEGNYNLTGIGIAYDKHHRVYVTQIFLKD